MLRVALLLAAGCGRLAFDPLAASRDGGASPDGADLGSGLVAHYPMDDVPAGSIVAAVGPAAICTSTCPTATAAGRIGGAHDYDGTMHVQIQSSAFTGTAPHSVSVWALANGAGDLTIVSEPLTFSGEANIFKLGVDDNGGHLEYETTDGAMTFQKLTSVGVDLRGAWHHVATTWDGTTKRVYVDGVERGATAAAPVDAALLLVIGADVDFGAPTLRFVGTIDDLRFYDRVLDGAAIAALAGQ